MAQNQYGSSDESLDALKALASGVPPEDIRRSSKTADSPEPEPKPAEEPSPAPTEPAPAGPEPESVDVSSLAIAGDQQLAQIQFYGLNTVMESTLRGMISAREMAPYSRKAQAADMDVLLKSGLFKSVSLRRVPISDTSFRLDVRVEEGRPEPAAAADRAGKSNERLEAEAALGAAEPEIPQAPWVLGELEVRGNKNVKTSVIRAQIEARKGDLYQRSDLTRDVNKVDSLGGFERVVADISVLKDQRVPDHFREASPSPHPIHLTFIVEEKPLVHKILFEGRHKVTKGRLRDEMKLKERDALDRVQLREDVEKVLEAYHKKGYHRAEVDTRVSVDTETLKAVVTYVIQEGPRAKIKEVRLHGAEVFKASKVIRKSKVKNKRKKVYRKETFEEDLKGIEAFYKNRGYQDFKILGSSVTFSEDQTEIIVDISLSEGRLYRFGDTTFTGNAVYASTSLYKALDYKKGKIFNQEKFDYTVREIQELYAEKGRLRTVLDHRKEFNDSTGLLDVHFDLIEGNIVYVDHVDVEGAKATKDYVFKREIVIKPGMPFSVSKIRKSQERIRNLGFIDDVGLDVQSPYDPELVDLTFEVFEGKPGMLTAGAGFSSLDGLVGTLSVQHLNLLGRAYRTSVSWSFGSRVNDFNIGWTTPWLREKPISLGFDVFNTRRISPFEGSGSAFTNKRTGGSVRLGPRFQDDKYQMNLLYTFQKISVNDVEAQFRGILPEGTSSNSLIGAEIARDTRDNIWDPTSGSRHSIGANFSGGPLQGDIHYFKPFINNSWHKTLFSVSDYPFVLSFSNRMAYITPFNETKEVPVFERFYIGGQDTLRGYAVTGEVGARNGGKVYDVFNVEFGFPLARERRRTIVKFVTFFDAGTAWENTRSMRLKVGQGEQDIKTDVGFGIRFTTPAFPIRLDWGYGLQHRPGEDKTQINFGIGSLF